MLPSTVLYAEDDQDSAFFMRKAFERAGLPHPLHVVEDGVEALGLLEKTRRATPPAAVLLDINLPRRSGFEVLRWIREQPEYRALPVFLFSSSSCDGDRRRAEEFGASGFFFKPASTMELTELVRRLSSQWISPVQAGSR